MRLAGPFDLSAKAIGWGKPQANPNVCMDATLGFALLTPTYELPRWFAYSLLGGVQ